LDDQVKVRGYRVELGEIESVLREQPGVVEAAVVALDANDGEKILVGCVVGATAVPIDLAAVRDGLAARVPEHLVPGRIVALPALPLSANGKIDRQALQEVARIAVTQSQTAYIGPRSPLEDALCKIWSELLGSERVGVEDNFFALGGHSLLATRVVSRIRALLHVEMPLETLFTAPTVADLAIKLAEDPVYGAIATRVAELLWSLRDLSDDQAAAMLASRDT
jgi:acyl carrier protein